MLTKRTSVSDKLAALKEGRELPVDLGRMHVPGTYLDVDEKAALTLARTYERERDPDYVSISWASQVRAQAFFNEHGLAKTLAEILRIDPEGLD